MIADLVKFGSEGQDDREGMNWKRNETKIRLNQSFYIIYLTKLKFFNEGLKYNKFLKSLKI